MNGIRFLHPEIAWWLAGLLAAAIALRVFSRRRVGLATTTTWVFERSHRASLVRRVPAIVFLAGLLLLGGALMDPVLPLAEREVRSQGLDIVIALDLSSSMEEQMGHGRTRLEATKDAIKAFVGRRIDDRIGLVVFSDNAYVVSPPTVDHRYLVRYIDMVDDQLLRGEGMTAIGEGLGLANALLARRAPSAARGTRVVVIFTDGENTIGRDPLGALGDADAAGIRVHLVGVDLEEAITKKPEVQALLRAVTRYGGRYFNAGTPRELEAASHAIDAIEKGVLVSRRYERDAPVFHWFALPALVSFAIGFAVRAIPAFIDQT